MLLREGKQEGTVNNNRHAPDSFHENSLFISKHAVAALPGPGAVVGRPAVRRSRQLEASPPSLRLGSRQTLSLQHQTSSSHLLSDRGMAPSLHEHTLHLLRHTQALRVRQWPMMRRRRSEKTSGGVEALVRMSAALTLLSSLRSTR